jgi:thiamine phosphate synthase YjbQ (UPF0047 family)
MTTRGRTTCPRTCAAALTATSLRSPWSGGRMVLGTWQGIYLAEHRAHPHRRQVVVHLMGE